MHVCSQCCGRLFVSSWLGSEGDPAFTLTGTVYTCEHTLNTHYAHADRWPDTHSHIHTHTRTHAHTCDRSVGEVRRKVKIFRWYTGNSVRLRLTKQFLCTTRCAGHLTYIYLFTVVLAIEDIEEKPEARRGLHMVTLLTVHRSRTRQPFLSGLCIIITFRQTRGVRERPPSLENARGWIWWNSLRKEKPDRQGVGLGVST